MGGAHAPELHSRLGVSQTSRRGDRWHSERTATGQERTPDERTRRLVRRRLWPVAHQPRQRNQASVSFIASAISLSPMASLPLRSLMVSATRIAFT